MRKNKLLKHKQNNCNCKSVTQCLGPKTAEARSTSQAADCPHVQHTRDFTMSLFYTKTPSKEAIYTNFLVFGLT